MEGKSANSAKSAMQICMRIVRNLRILTFLSAKIWSTGFSRPDYIRKQLTKYTPASNAGTIDEEAPDSIRRKGRKRNARVAERRVRDAQMRL